MSLQKKGIISYIISRANETLDDAKISADNKKRKFAVNRLYYAAFYAVSALLLKKQILTNSHNGIKAKLSEHFIITNKLSQDLGKYILNCLLSDKKENMMIGLILTR